MFDSEYATSAGPDRQKVLLGIILALACVGLAVSGYLTWTTWSATEVAGCSGGEAVDCDYVLSSHWSKWLGIPVSLFGALTYLGILVTVVLFARDEQSTAPTLLLTCTLMAAGSATWFVGLQIFLLESFCLYCMAVHLCSLTICGLTIFLLRSNVPVTDHQQMSMLLGVNPYAATDDQQESPSVSSCRPILASGVAAGGVLVLMLGQFLFGQDPGLQYEELPTASSEIEETATVATVSESTDAETTEQTPTDPPEVLKDGTDDETDSLFETENDELMSSASPEPRMISFGGLQEPIDVTNVPILGSPDAEHVLLEMLDYTCPHCRNLHPHVEASLERYGNQLAFVVFHVPLSKKCNPHVKRDHWSHRNACDYARLALSTWRLDRSKFAEYHSWLMSSKRPPVVVEARRTAMDLVGAEVLLDENLKADSLRSFAGNSDDMKKMHTGLPLILTTRGMLKGVPKTEAEWFKFLEETLGIEPVAGL